MAEDAAKVAPHVYKVVFENEQARVLEVTMEAGARSELHAHPDYFVYVITPGKVRFTTASGESQEAELPAGAALRRPAEEHATGNIGASAIRAIFFEPK
jgi:quercetin dioxygenase-like cupin family protein